MRAYLDTNVIVDVLKDSRESHLDSATILKLARQGYIEAVVSTQTVLDAYYLFSVAGEYPLEEFKLFLSTLLSAVSVTSISENNLKAAIRSANRDFGDASQIDCASTGGCDCIISSDRKMKRDSPVPVHTPAEFCGMIFKPWHY